LSHSSQTARRGCLTVTTAVMCSHASTSIRAPRQQQLTSANRPSGIMTPMADELWPPLPFDEWKDTYATLHMWTQIVGKVALAQAPPLNHSWSIAMQVTPRGLSTRTLSHRDRSFSIQFDFIDHQLVIRA